MRLADAAQHSSGSGGTTPRSPDASSSAAQDVSFPFDELGIGEPKSIPLEPTYIRCSQSQPPPPKEPPRPMPKSIPLEPPKHAQLYSSTSGSRHHVTEPKSIPLERAGESATSRPVREVADSPQERPVLKSRWTPLIVTPDSPPPPKAVEESPASPDTQTASPQVYLIMHRYSNGSLNPDPDP
jgi:hypothetical protein